MKGGALERAEEWGLDKMLDRNRNRRGRTERVK